METIEKLLQSFIINYRKVSETFEIAFEEITDLPVLEVKLKEIINTKLPDIEKGVMNLLYYENRIQQNVADILGISQEMVVYFKGRSLKKIAIFYFLDKIDLCEFKKFLLKNVNKRQMDAILAYFKIHDLKKVTEVVSKKGRLHGIGVLHYKSIGMRIKNAETKLLTLKLSDEEKKYLIVIKMLRVYNTLYGTQSRQNKDIIKNKRVCPFASKKMVCIFNNVLCDKDMGSCKLKKMYIFEDVNNNKKEDRLQYKEIGERVRNFITKNPEIKFSEFHKKFPDVASNYFWRVKSNIRKRLNLPPVPIYSSVKEYMNYEFGNIYNEVINPNKITGDMNIIMVIPANNDPVYFFKEPFDINKGGISPYDKIFGIDIKYIKIVRAKLPTEV